MRREQLISHLEDNGCYSDGSYPENTEIKLGEWWVNAVNSEECIIPLEEELQLTTWGQIIYELKVDCIPDFDSEYEVFKIWRDHQLDQPNMPEPTQPFEQN